MVPSQVNIGLAFLAGMASFLAPCVLPLVPAYLSYLSGYSITQSNAPDRKTRGHVVAHAAVFVLGFSIVFVLLGTAVGALGSWVRGDWLRVIGGLVMVVFGLSLTGLLHVPLFEREAHVTIGRKGHWGFASSLLAGFAFAAGWTPCYGPVLSSILILSADQDTLLQSVLLLVAYAAGIGLPFILVGLVIERAGTWISRISRHQPIIRRAVGVFVIVMGIVLLTDSFSTIGIWLEGRGIGWDLGI